MIRIFNKEMCDKCFDEEYDGFQTAKEYEEFKYNLERKIIEQNGLYLLDSFSHKLLGIIYIYKCSVCSSLRYFSKANGILDSFFLSDEKFNKKAKLYVKQYRNYRITGVFLMIISFFVASVIAVKCAN